jgi:ribosomal protein S20
MEQLGKTMKLLDQLAARGVIHRNKVANDKSKLSKFVRTLS